MPPVPVELPEFGLFTLKGARFDREGMPVEALVELVTYRDLLIEMSKIEYRDRHPHARRLPKGFAEALQLRITTVRQGSATAVIVRDPVEPAFDYPQDGPNAPRLDLFEQGRDSVESVINAILEDKDPPIPVGRTVLRMFANLGRTLRVGESLGLGAPGTTEVRTLLTRAGREKIKKYAGLATRTRPERIYGSIIEVNTQRQTCIVQTERRQVSCEYTISMAALLRGHLADEGTGRPKVALDGTAEIRDDGDPRTLLSVDVVQLAGADAMEVVVTKLAMLDALRPGWDGPGSVPPSASVRSKYEEFLDSLNSRVTPEVEPIALPDGGIRMEWERRNTNYVAEIEASGGMYMCSLGDLQDDDDDRELTEFSADVLARFFENGALG